jgi:hypothetical protein
MDDSAALATAIDDVLRDPADARARAAAARQRFEAELTITAVGQRMAELFRSATSH